jgi:restriction endonuclease Mrr
MTAKQLQAMPWHEFEKLVQQVFERRGCQVHRHEKSQDGGVDLWVQGELRGRYCAERMMRHAIVQCKCFDGHSVGRPVVQNLYGVMLGTDQDLGFIVTSSKFTRLAIEDSKFKEIKLIDGQLLATLMNDPTIDL